MRELYLVSFRGFQYGIWHDEVMSVRNIDCLHRLPFSPASIAGIMIDGQQTVTLADLSACIGDEPSPVNAQGGILLMEEDKKITGFVASGALNSLSVAPELIFNLPDYLKTAVLGTCVVHNNIPIPLIKISELYAKVWRGERVFTGEPLRTFAVQPQEISAIAKIRFFVAGGDIFAASAAGMDSEAVKPGSVTPLPNTPLYVQGVTFWNGRVLPVIDLSQRIKRQRATRELKMLIADPGDDTFGLLVDSDGGTLLADKVAIKPAPMIMQTPWLKDVVVRAGEIIPFLDIALSLSPGVTDDIPIWQCYTPDSSFAEQFFTQDVEVVEFSLLGERHSLPKEEVEDSIAFKPCRALPDMPPVVIGVAELNGEILPVVDLAMMFGRRSIATPAWRMILLHNGDFRALVLTEAVYEQRQLAPDKHRAVPINLPHQLVYGCYPDANAVRLILNVEAISVHFEKSLIQKFLPALSPQMRMASAEVEAVHFTAEPVAIAMHEQASVYQRAHEATPEQTAASHSSSARQNSREEIIVPESEKMGEQSPSDELKSSSHQEFSKTSPEPVSAAKAGSLLAGEAALDDSQILQPVSATANARSGTAYRFDRQAEHHAVSSSHAERLAGKRKIAYGVIAVALVAALLYLAGVSDKPAVEKFVQEMLPTKIEQAKAPLELDIPKNMPPVDIDVYVVVKDDTLWSISERFTGNPFNYPRIAGGNQIANPDLIYPGQRIRLIK